MPRARGFRGSRYTNAKVLLVGDSGVGKTMLLRLVDKPLATHHYWAPSKWTYEDMAKNEWRKMEASFFFFSPSIFRPVLLSLQTICRVYSSGSIAQIW